MDEVNETVDNIRSITTRSRLRKASRYALAALVGAAALAVVARKTTDTTETAEEA